MEPTPLSEAAKAPRRRRRWRKLLMVFAFGIIVLVGGYFAAYGIALARSGSDLRAAIAEVDAAEPGGWQLEDLEARRPQVPDDKNGSKVLLELAPLFPQDWQAPKWLEEFSKLRPCEVLDGDAIATLKEQLAPLDQVRAKAGQMVNYPGGRFPSTPMSADFAFQTPPHWKLVNNARDVLFADAVLHAHEQDVDRACQATLAMVFVGRSMASEQSAFAQLVRQDSNVHAVWAVERILGQGKLSEDQLVRLILLFEEESAENLTPYSLRCERAALHRFFLGLESGEIDFARVAHHDRWGTYADMIYCPLGLTGSMVRNSHAYVIRYLTNGLEPSMNPNLQRKSDLLHAWAVEFKIDLAGYKVPRLARDSPVIAWKIATSELKTKTHLACAIAGLAAEQYRIRHQRWPTSLEDLVAEGILKRAPLDTFDGKALTLRPTEDGIVIYSAAYSKDYHGNARDVATGTLGDGFLEFRLWNESKRRQPKPPEGER
jgi:hypothetical protein